MVQLASELKYTDNIWAGVSVERQDLTYRIDDLRKIPARIRWLSIETTYRSVETES